MVHHHLSALDIAIGAQAVNRSSVAALTALVYDVLLSFNEEVMLIWPQRWSLMKVLFFFIRYVPILVQVSLLFVGTELTPLFHFSLMDCYIWQIYQSVVIVVLMGAVDIILILRLSVLYRESPIVKCSLWLAYFLEIAGWFTGLFLAIPGVRTDKLCTVISMPRAIVITGISTIVFQTFLLILMMYKFLRCMILEKQLGRTLNQRITALMMRDGTWAFVLLFAILVGHASLFALDNSSYAGILYCWQLSAFSFVGYRILLNLRHITIQVQEPPTERSTSPVLLTSVWTDPNASWWRTQNSA